MMSLAGWVVGWVAGSAKIKDQSSANQHIELYRASAPIGPFCSIGYGKIVFLSKTAIFSRKSLKQHF